ncbi:hypothetical protein BJX99DRAFT_253877 [Aspergillus californicus]
MDEGVFDLSPALPAEFPKEDPINPVGPVNIPFEITGRPYALVDEKALQIVEAENQELDDLMNEFTKGFDPGSFREFIMDFLPKLSGKAYPGNYAHLLLLLYQSYDMVQSLQLDMEDLMLNQFRRPIVDHPNPTSFTDETVFAAEIEMLRRLLAPIRDGSKKSIFWLSSRRADPARTCEQLEASIRVIEQFKKDVCAALEKDDDKKTTYTNLPISVERTAIFSMKQLRLDSCKATLFWDNFNGAEIEFTSFYRFYKAHISKTEPARARASGWLPPLSPQSPRLSAQEAVAGDLASWVSHGVDIEIIDVLLKTAMWLSVARGLAAVHLFCDVARLFVLNKSLTTMISGEYLCFLRYLTRLRAAPNNAKVSTTPPVPREDETFPKRNVDYFEDVWRSSHALSAGLYQNMTLFVKHNNPDFKLQPPPRRRRHADMHIITEVPLPEPQADTPTPTSPHTPDQSSHDNEDEYGFYLSPDKPSSRNNTV